jgi:protein-disulfide isomerase
MRKEIKILGAVTILVIIGGVVGASYYRNSVQGVPVASNTGTNEQRAKMEQLVRPDSYTMGPADAPVTLVEFLDPECESCRAFYPAVKNILKQYDGKVRLVVRYMPLHPNSYSAATFTEAAGEQGKYWQAQEYLFDKQPEWGTKHGPSTTPQPNVNLLFPRYAMDLGLDVDKIDAAFKDGRFKAKIDRDKKDGEALGVRATPTFFVNGRRVVRLRDGDIKAMIEEELKQP